MASNDDEGVNPFDDTRSVLKVFGVESLAPKNAEFFTGGAIAFALQRGDHVAVCAQRVEENSARGGAGGEAIPPIWHHGIFVGIEDGKGMFIHMLPSDSKGGALKVTSTASVDVHKSTWEDFSNGCNRHAIVQYEDDSAERREASAKVAEYLLAYANENPGKMTYKIGTHMVCDGFATFCRTGRYGAGATLVMPQPPPIPPCGRPYKDRLLAAALFGK